MAKEENKEIKELEKKIKKIQADIDRLCELSNRTEDGKNVKITISHLIGVAVTSDGNFVDFEMINDPSNCYNYSVDELINDLMTQKRIMEIDLHQLQIVDDEDE